MVTPLGDPHEPKKLVSITELLDQHRAQIDTSPESPQSSTPAYNWEPVTGDSVLDKFSNLATWNDILEPVGWTEAKVQDTETLQAWKRPGGTHDISAKVPKVAPGTIVVWSTDAGLPSGPDQKLNKAKVYAHLHYGGDLSAASKALIRGEAVGLPTVVVAACKTEPPSNGNGHIEVTADQITSSNETVDDIKQRFPRIDWHELWADQKEEVWIHKPLLGARRLVALYSGPKIGKSLLLLEMAVAISHGEPFLGFTPTERRRVLYVDHENDPRGDILTRLQDMEYKPDHLDHLDYLSFPTMAALDSLQGGMELLAAVNAYESEIVVIDTVSRAIDGEENSNDTWLNFYRRTGLKLKQAGVAMIRLDHSGKDESKGMRGGSAKYGDVDAVWRLTKVTDEKLRLECSESRMRIDTKQLKINRNSKPLRHELESADATTEAEAKIAELIRHCDNDDLPADANRDAVREVAKKHGMKVATKLIGEVVKRRKADPTLPVSTSENDLETANQSEEVSSGQPDDEGPI